MLTKLHRTTLAEQAVQSLWEYIVTARLKPGDALPSEARLALDLGVSRQIIREAVKSLEGKGVLAMINGKGAIVKPIDAGPLQTFFQRAMQLDTSTILELMDVRRGIEIQSALLAARKRTPEDLAQLSEIVQRMSQSLHDLESYIELDATFHLNIAAAGHNTLLYHLVASLHSATRDSIQAGLEHRHTDQELQRVQQLHETLLQQIEIQDEQGAIQAMAQHFDEAITALVTPEPA